MTPPHDSSGAWPLPPWMMAVTGPHPTLIPERPERPRRPRTHSDGRPITLSVVPRVESSMGRTKRASPPPDLARVASSFALLGALFLALILSWALGG
jgi:hypothetical protein